MVRKQRPDVEAAKIAEAIGVSYKHMYRLETGETNVSAEDLFQLARGYALPVSFFFKDAPENEEDVERLRLLFKSDPRNWQPGTADEQEAALLALWRALESEGQRRNLLELLESLVFVEREKGKRGRR